MKPLDEIMSGEGGSVPEPEAHSIEAQPEPQPETQPDEALDTDPQADERGMVPHAALHAAREQGKKRYTEAVTEFERRLKESEERAERRFMEMMGALRPQPQQPPQAQPQQPPVDPLDLLMTEPDKFVQQHTSQALDPVRQALDFNARLTAEAIFDRENPGTVKAAEEAFNAAAASGRMDTELHRRINSSPNPYYAAVQWHQSLKRQEALSRYGDDPEAAFEAEVQRRLSERTGQQAQPSPQTPQAMPSSFAAGRNAGPRAAPQWSGPKPLSEIMGGR